MDNIPKKLDEPDVSIIIPLYNDLRFIGNTIDSILQTNSKFIYEIIIVDGSSIDGSDRIVRDYEKKFANLRLLVNDSHNTSSSLNLGIRNAKGDFVIIIGSHTAIESNYIEALVNTLKIMDADVVGATGYTVSVGHNRKSKAIAAVLSDRFGVGNSLFRTGVSEIKEVDTVAYGCYKKEVFDKFGLFNERLIRNQDIEFNKRIKNGGGKIYLTPETNFFYYARDNHRDFAKNNFSNGYWSIITPIILKNYKSESVRHYIPFIFISSILFTSIFSLFINYFYIIPISIIVLYLLCTLINSILVNKKNNYETDNTNILNIFISFIILHFSYGLGSLRAFLDVISGKYKKLLRNKNEYKDEAD